MRSGSPSTANNPTTPNTGRRAGSPPKSRQGTIFGTVHQVNTNGNQNAIAALNASNASAVASATPSQTVKKNAKGGVLVTPDEIQAAFALLDSEKNGSITIATLKKKIGVFFPDMTSKDYRFLMNNKKELTVEDLNELLLDNEIANFDPVLEAFKIYDTRGDGSVNLRRLRDVFAAYGFGEVSDEELDILVRAADLDGDGVISVNDFRSLVETAKLQEHSLSAMPSSPNTNTGNLSRNGR